MICTNTTKEVEAEMYKHYKSALDVKHAPQFIIDYAKAYIHAYDFKNGGEFPELENDNG